MFCLLGGEAGIQGTGEGVLEGQHPDSQTPTLLQGSPSLFTCAVRFGEGFSDLLVTGTSMPVEPQKIGFS